ncbi:MAG: tyrosine-type recombinase/integrase [Pseudobdellovibrio sp.]|nr:tyrosine-type recombinase/integrase [Pseudobdellovibrio sp.]
MACVTKFRGKWVVDYKIFGKRKRPEFDNRASADAFLRELRLRKIDNLIGYRPSKTVGLSIATEEYLSLVTPLKEPRTREVDLQTLNKFRQFFDGCFVQDIQLQQLEKYQLALLNSGLKASSVNRKFNVIRHFFRKCFEWKYCHENPTLDLKKLKEDPVVRKVLELHEIENIINSLPQWAANAFYFISKTGVRRGELCNLKWENVDFDSNIITVFTKKGGGSVKATYLPMTKDVRMFMLGLRNQHTIKSNSSYVFLNADNNPIIPSTLTRKVIELREQGMTNVGLHIVRHTLLTGLSNANQSGAVIQKVANHSSLGTSQRYLQHNVEDVQRAFDKLEAEKPIRLPRQMFAVCQ